MILHLITALTRPENLPAIAASIQAAQRDHITLHWHIQPGQPDDPGGQHTKNRLLDQITDGWVNILDDDTTLHPGLPDHASRHTHADAVVVRQQHHHYTLTGNPPQLGNIDAGQVVFRRALAGDRRIPEQYDGDGHFFADILAGANVIYLPQILSVYNTLRED